MAVAHGHADGKIRDLFLEHQMTVWQRLVALFRFDFRSAFGSAPRLPVLDTGAAEREEKILLPFELDVQKLNFIQYRRQVLNWRDEFAVQMLADGKEMFRQFSEHVEQKLDDIGILQKLFSKPAAEVLQGDFHTFVRLPLEKRVKIGESQLAKVIQSHPSPRLAPLRLTVEVLDPSLSILGDLKFRTSNREELLSKLNHFVFGERGVIDCYLERAQTVSLSVLHESDAKA